MPVSSFSWRQWLDRLFALCILLLLLMVDLLPIWSLWGLSPAFTLSGVFYLTLLHPSAVSIEVLVVLGLIQDGVYAYPLGLSILVNLLAYGLILTQRKYLDQMPFKSLWTVFAAFTVIGYCLHWALVSFAHRETLDILMRLPGALLTILTFPWIARLLQPWIVRKNLDI